jgi:hypothetical protein
VVVILENRDSSIVPPMTARIRSIEHDEGKYAYAGQLMLEGIPPYRSAYNINFPEYRLAAKPSRYGFHPVATKTGRFSNGLTQLVEGSISTAASRE